MPLLRADGPPAAPADHGRVVVVHDPAATDAFQPRPERVHEMVRRGMEKLTGKTNAAEAWSTLVSTQDIIGIKVYSTPGAGSGTRPAVVEGVVRGLLAANVPGKNIVIWDRQKSDLRLAGYYDVAERLGVRVDGAANAGFDEEAFYNPDVPIVGALIYGDLEFGRKGLGVGRKSFISKLVSKRLTKIINITPLLNHNTAGVCGNLFSLATGSVDNVRRFEVSPRRLADAVPEIYALPQLSDRVVLNITDALICQYHGEQHSLLHYSAVLNELRFSKDPVALDYLSLRELDRQRQAAKDAPPSQSLTNHIRLIENATLLELGTGEQEGLRIERWP
jgi:hypothetical protein